jgi:hypothetical protein
VLVRKCVEQRAQLPGILDAGRRLDAGGDVNGPGPQLQDAGNDVCGMQPTRQNEPMGNAAGNERPIEDPSAATEGLDMGVEKEALGLAETPRLRAGAISAM